MAERTPEQDENPTDPVRAVGWLPAGRWLWDQRVLRAAMRYHFGGAALAAGGVTWSAVISLTAVLTIVVNAARLFLGENPVLLDEGLAAINATIPGLIDDGTNSGIIDPNSLVVDSFWNPITLGSLIVALWTSLSVMAGLRRSIRAMFGLGGAPLIMYVGKARDLLGFIGLAVGMLISLTLTTAFGPFAHLVLGWIGVAGGATGSLAVVAATLLAGLVDALVFAMLFRVTAGVHVVRRDLMAGSLLGALGTGLLRWAGSSVLGVVDNPVLASFTAVATLALILSLAVRLTLFVAAWTANPPQVPFFLPPETIRVNESPNYVTRSAPHTLEWPYHAVTGSLLPTDRTTGEAMDAATDDDGDSTSAPDAPPGPREQSASTARRTGARAASTAKRSSPSAG